MAPEETLLDPPVTPAHLFAYRALRGWFAGSPDSPDDDKENLSPVTIKTLAGNTTSNSDDVLRLSPQKRKRDSLAIPLSPTKSILRTPGAPTPRAKSLRDMNVKFKSASPEVRRKDLKMGVKNAEGNIQPTTQAAAGNSDHKASILAPSPATVKLKPQPPVLDPAVYDTNLLDDQNRRTAREMKRLVRYGTKWRDFARRRDEENAKLRLLLEDTRRENRRLEAVLRKIEREPQVAVVTESRPTVTTTAPAAEQRSSSAPTSKSACHLLSIVSDTQSLPKPPVDASIMPAHALPRRPVSDSVPSHSPLTALQHRIEGSILPISDATRTGMDPGRLAATRKRLMAKTQARRTGGKNILAELGAVEGDRRPKTKDDDSAVDWADI